MLQERPYAPLRYFTCLCHAPCRDFYRMGQRCRLWTHGATEPFAFLNAGHVMLEGELDRPCEWYGPVITHAEPYPWYTVGVRGVVPEPLPSNGLPYLGSVSVVGEIIGPFGPEAWEVRADLGGSEQMDCRDAGGGEPVVIQAPPTWRWPFAFAGATWHMQWVARRDTWQPPS